MLASATVIPLGAIDLTERVGRGGMAEVWSGVHREQQVPVAVKVVSSQDVPMERLHASLRNEVRAMARLDHPAILMVFDYGEVSDEDERRSQGKLEQGSPYLVTELAPDGSVAPRCGNMPWSEVRRLLLSLLDALAHAHARGVLHRDVKPTNVLMFGDQAKLSDFGVALELDPSRAAAAGRGLQGTPAYMAPEQFSGQWRDYGPATDLYALGCLAHTLTCGRPPYGQWADLSLMFRLHHEGVPIPLETKIAVPPGFDYWLRRLLEKKPKHRYQHAADAAQGLRELGRPISSAASTDDSPPSSRSSRLVESVSEMPTVRADFAPLEAAESISDESTSGSSPPIDAPPDFPPTWHRAKPEGHGMGVLGAGIGLYGLRAIPMVGRGARARRAVARATGCCPTQRDPFGPPRGTCRLRQIQARRMAVRARHRGGCGHGAPCASQPSGWTATRASPHARESPPLCGPAARRNGRLRAPGPRPDRGRRG